MVRLTDFTEFLFHQYSSMSDIEFDALTDEDHRRLIEQWTAQFHEDNHRAFAAMTKDLPASPSHRARRK